MAVCTIAFLRNVALMAIAVLMITSTANAGKKKVKEPEGPSITRESWPEHTLGKKVWLLFHYPWCTHCQSFKGSWKRLKNHYKDDDKIAFLDINCDIPEGDYVCTDFGVTGVPEVWYGDSALMEEYTGKLDDKNIISFIETNMTDACSVNNVEGCPEEDRTDTAAIDKLTTEYLKKITALKIDDPSFYARQAVKNNYFKNPFWEDVSGVQKAYGSYEDDNRGQSSSMSLDDTLDSLKKGSGEL